MPRNSPQHLEPFTKATYVVLPLGLIDCVQQLWERPDLLYQVICSSLPRRWVNFPISRQKAALSPARAGQGDVVPGAPASFRGPAAPPCGASAETPLGAERSAAPPAPRPPAPAAGGCQLQKPQETIRCARITDFPVFLLYLSHHLLQFEPCKRIFRLVTQPIM